MSCFWSWHQASATSLCMFFCEISSYTPILPFSLQCHCFCDVFWHWITLTLLLSHAFPVFLGLIGGWRGVGWGGHIPLVIVIRKVLWSTKHFFFNVVFFYSGKSIFKGSCSLYWTIFSTWQSVSLCSFSSLMLLTLLSLIPYMEIMVAMSMWTQFCNLARQEVIVLFLFPSCTTSSTLSPLALLFFFLKGFGSKVRRQ